MLDPKLLLVGIIQAILVLVLAPFYAGLARKLRARAHSREGPPIRQYYLDIIKLMKRQEVRPPQATWIFRATPWIVMVGVLLVAMIIPILTLQSPLGVAGDLLVVIYLFAMVRFFLGVAGMDSGSGYSGLGLIREMSLSVMVEPTLLLVLIVLALLAGSTNLGTISQAVAVGKITYASPAIWLALIGFAIAAFVETGKLPFDIAEAEQEVQEGVLTEYSGPSLALLKWGLFTKQVVVMALLLAVFFPWGGFATLSVLGVIIAVVIFFLKVTVLYVLAALVENTMARLTLFGTPNVTWLALGIALISFVFYLVQV